MKTESLNDFKKQLDPEVVEKAKDYAISLLFSKMEEQQQEIELLKGHLSDCIAELEVAYIELGWCDTTMDWDTWIPLLKRVIGSEETEA